MRSSRKNRSNGDNVSHRRNVDQAKAARAKAAIKAAKSQSPKSVYKNRKLKAAVDLETPKSLLVNIRLKSVINLDTYSLLSRVEKERLVVLLPSCDQQKDRSGMPILNSEALNNEFFAKACVEWCERLGEGEFLKDRQQGEASSAKVRPFGTTLNGGAKSHAIESLSTDTKLNRNANRHSTISPKSPLLRHATRLRNGSGRRISVKLMSDRNTTTSIPQRCRQRARNLRLEQLALDDDASLVSETSSESSLSVYGEQSRVGSSCLGYGGDGSSLATRGSNNNIRSRVTRCETSLNRVSELFVHPALRDHDYAESMVESRSKNSRVSTGRGRYRRRRGKRRRVRSKKPDSVGVIRSGGVALKVQGRGFRAPVDMLASGCGSSLTANALATVKDVLYLNGAKVDCKDDDATNSQVLSFDNSLTSNLSVRNNGRLNGACSPNKREHGHSAPAQNPANITAHDSWLKENDVNLNYVTRPHRLKTVQHLRKCEQTDGMPLIQIQGSDLLSRVSCANSETVASVVRGNPCNSPVLPSSLRFGKTEFNVCDRDFTSPPASDPQNTRTTSDVDCSNSASLQRLDPIRSNDSGVSSDCRTKPDEKKFFVKLIGVQKITRDCETKEEKPNRYSGEFDSSLDSVASILPRSVVQEVQRYARVGGNVPYVGQHSLSSPVQCNGKLSLGHSLEISFPSNDIRSHEDSVEHTSLSMQTDVRENGLPRRNNMQNFKLIPDLRNPRPNCSRALDASECVWEAVRREADAADRGH